ncbi:hypothetical protein [Bradyrhizobium sp. AUGA SZCCT0042]|uniref:hypothetical protein n=1 Tax=Bradyrhizobium sp. AUGA SZCCT0042 TaxID=2807651 RepID=UPI001BAB9C58|nr:hypothetical protein [Bradyrhizobium sp. AUGA SZCCT0042]MBR1302146.1 hypothetical protein [Bradyrhizobium sp. AUGA SZCCT0042]
MLGHFEFFTAFAFNPISTSRGHWLISQHQQSLHNRAETNEYNEQLEEIPKLGVGRELFNRPKADRADDHDNQNPDQK